MDKNFSSILLDSLKIKVYNNLPCTTHKPPDEYRIALEQPKKPKKFEDIDEKTPDQMRIIAKYYNNPVGFLLMSGTNGNGKSFVAEVIYQKFTKYVLPSFGWDEAIFLTQSDLNERYLKDHPDTLYLTNCLKNTPCLVLDDFGTRPPSDGFSSFLYSIIEHRWRYSDSKATIITTNLKSHQVQTQFGDPILSRIASNAICKFEGNDRRMNYDF